MAKRDAPDVIESLRVNGPAQPTESEEVEWGGGELTFATQAQLKERLAVICQQDAERRDFFEVGSNTITSLTAKWLISCSREGVNKLKCGLAHHNQRCR